MEWPLVAFLALIGITSLISLGIALFDVLQGALLLMRADTAGSTALFTVAAGNIARVVLLLPAAYYALVRLARKPPHHLAVEAVPTWAIISAWAACITLGALAVRFDLATVLFIPPLSVVATLLPIWLIARLAIHRLEHGSDLRGWGSLSLGTTAGPFLSTVLEGGFILLLLFLIVLAVLTSDALREALVQVARQIEAAPTEQALLRLLVPLFLDRRAVFVAFMTLCIVTPIIEEALKPIAVWLGAGRLSAPAQGFALGALCGAGFAAFESLMATASAGSDWATVVLLRAGTDIMHTTNAAFMGWALVLAWQEHRYVRLALVYLAAIVVHGSWNLLALTYGLSNLPSAVAGLTPDVVDRAPFALPALVVISLAMLGVLAATNHHLRRGPKDGLTVSCVPLPGEDMQV
jgi:RsiW-degrading membrane proteinase PrsW (M82 family)